LCNEIDKFPWEEKKIDFPLSSQVQAWLNETLQSQKSTGKRLVAQEVHVKVCPVLDACCEVQGKDHKFWILGSEKVVLLDDSNSQCSLM